MPEPIVVSAVVLRDPLGRVLTVRKRGTVMFMLPGGKHEPGESPLDAAVREATEELGVAFDAAAMTPLGTFTTAAANEPGHLLVSHVYAHPLVDGVTATNEIEQLRWLAPGDDLADVAPLLVDAVLPVLTDGPAPHPPAQEARADRGATALLAQARAGLRRLSAQEAYAAQQEGAVIVDVRTSDHREASANVPGALVIDLTVLPWRLDPTFGWRIPEATSWDTRYVVVCRHGFSSSVAAATLQRIGLRNATDVVGGYAAWEAAGLPTTHDPADVRE